MNPDVTFTDAELVVRLERTIHTLTKRVYSPTLRVLYDDSAGADRTGTADRADKGSVIVLSTLDERGQLRASELAAIVCLDLSTVSRHVSYFEQLGLVAREPDPNDRRASRISITERGRAGLAALRAARIAALDSVFASWPAADRADFHRLLDRLQSDLAALPYSPSPSTQPSPETTA